VPIWSFGERTWEELRDLDTSKSVALLPVGAIEAHGPHLPLETDVVIAEAMARAGAERLSSLGWTVLLLPVFPYTAAEFAAGFPGTLSVAPETVTALLLDVARGLARAGLPVLLLANSHLDPVHLAALDAVVAAAAAEDGLPRVVFPNLTKKPWALRLTEEFRSGACHAGQFETSVVLAARPERVREAIRRGLSPNPASLSRAIRDGVRSFEEAGGPDAYFGSPAQATAGEGEETIEVLGAIVADALADEWD
jgi:creatinine amidohydrolase